MTQQQQRRCRCLQYRRAVRAERQTATTVVARRLEVQFAFTWVRYMTRCHNNVHNYNVHDYPSPTAWAVGGGDPWVLWDFTRADIARGAREQR